jgi:hypothetical protein
MVSKNVMEPERLQIAVWRRVVFWIIKATRAQAHASAHAPTPTYARTRIRSRAHRKM